jgi:hypothetical protein
MRSSAPTRRPASARSISTYRVVLAPLIALAAMAADCPKPTDLGDGWTVAAPEQEGLDSALICGIGLRLEALKEAQAHGIAIARHGRLIYEHYFGGSRSQ